MKYKICGFAFAVLLGFTLFASPLMASEYIGEFCFRAETSKEGGDRLIKLGISHMGGSHFQIAGTWNWEDGSGKSAPINGNLEVIGDKFEFTYTFAFYNLEGIYYRVGHLELDTNSLAGELKMIKTKKDNNTGETSHGVSKMPVSVVSCP